MNKKVKLAAETIIGMIKINHENQRVTPQLIDEVIDEIFNIKTFSDLNKQQVRNEIEKQINVQYSGGGALTDLDASHTEWIYPNSGAFIDPERESKWIFWNHYKYYLKEEGWNSSDIYNIDKETNHILSMMYDPKQSGSWSTRGMVVGEVQSGKTSNYSGLIAKAADCGYKVIVIFAGLHNSLRSQTQDRLDNAFIGRNTDKDSHQYNKKFRIGVGNYPDHPIVRYFTTSNDKGDFDINTAQNQGGGFGHEVSVFVVKKNKSIINNLVNWCRRAHLHNEEVKIDNIPLLLIDDECDNASINTNKTSSPSEIPVDEFGNKIDEYDPTAINQGIRTLLNLFNQHSYIGYTATPFANILIHRQSEHTVYGRDLFPKDFIYNLNTSSNHTGPIKFFGLDRDDDLQINEVNPYPLYRNVNDSETYVPRKHKKDLILNELLPLSLKKAIYSFIIGCAVRSIRGFDKKHNSMLIHITRYTDVQEQIANHVQGFLDDIQNALKYGNGRKSILNILKSFWESDFLLTSRKMGEPIHSWDEIVVHIPKAMDKLLEVKKINGAAGDILEYKHYAQRGIGINVIAVGGDKLSRGLTLDGLITSYFLRASKMYDTLLQMGRWFGYRDGYLDTCRLYTSQDLYEWYRDITFASKELKDHFDYLKTQKGMKPEDFGMKVRSFPGLFVTSTNKMRSAQKRKVTYSGLMIQTLSCTTESLELKNNFKEINGLLGKKSCEEKEVGYIFDDIKSNSIINFLEKYKVHYSNKKFSSKTVIDYIKKQNNKRELINWSIALLSPKSKDTPYTGLVINESNGVKYRLTNRSSGVVLDQKNSVLKIKRSLVTKNHEGIDVGASNKMSREAIKRARDPKKGLLLIYVLGGEAQIESDDGEKYEEYGLDGTPVTGIGISFPYSKSPENVTYVIDAKLAEELDD